MKKTLLLIITTLLFSQPIMATGGNPKFKLIVFADTRDPRIGQAAMKQLDELNEWIDNVVSPALDMPVDPEYSEAYYDYMCCHDSLMSVLNRFSCDTDDIVLFWYLGHGNRSSDDTSRFPQMCLGELTEDKFVPLEAVKERIMQFKPRLCVVVGDCCNTLADWVSPKDNIIVANRADGSVITSSTKDFVEKLFGQAEGCFTISASSIAEPSWSNKYIGFHFTNAFIGTTEKMMEKFMIDGKPWQSIMDQLLDFFSSRRFRQAGDTNAYLMHPQYKFEPRRRVTKRKEYRYTIDNNLVDALGLIIKDRNAKDVESVLQRYFTDESTIILVGKNGTTVLGVFSARQYLDRMLGRTNLIKVCVRSMQNDTNGKVLKLFVHEVYIKY